jgi:integrase/recombinase XerD
MSLEEYLRQSVRQSTCKTYLYDIHKYQKYDKNVAKYDYQKVMQYIALLRQTYAISYIKKTIASLKKYYDYLIEIGKRKDNPARAIRIRDAKEAPIQLQDLLTEKELQSLLNPRKEKYPFLTKRNKIIMSLFVHQALRIGELASIKLMDIDLEKAMLQINKTGITNARSLPLKADQILLFYQYINQDRIKLITFRTKEEYFLLNKLGTATTSDDINYLISTYQKQFTKNLTSITIRQSVIANLLSKNNDLRVVQYFAGHKSPDTTEKYKETGLNALKTAVDKLHPIK